MLEQQVALKIAGEIMLAYPTAYLNDEHLAKWAVELMPLNEGDARRVVERITARLDSPPSRAQLRQAIDEIRQKTMSPRIDPSLCVFMDGVACRNCGEIHGHEIDPGQAFHGAYHLGRHRDGEPDELDRALHPERCDCGFVVPPDVDIERVVRLLIDSLLPPLPSGATADRRKAAKT